MFRDTRIKTKIIKQSHHVNNNISQTSSSSKDSLNKSNLIDSLSKPAIKALTIVASTVAVVEILKQDYSVGISAAISWLILVIATKKLKK